MSGVLGVIVCKEDGWGCGWGSWCCSCQCSSYGVCGGGGGLVDVAVW